MSRGRWIFLTIFLLAACRQKMAVQPRYDPLEPSDFFADHMSARPRIAGTVARGEAAMTGPVVTGQINGAEGYPFAIPPAVMNRGQERYNIYCSPCHGRLGDGNGMIPSRGYRRPPSYHTDALRPAKTGHFFDVMTNGFGALPRPLRRRHRHDRVARLPAAAVVPHRRAAHRQDRALLRRHDERLRGHAAVRGADPGGGPLGDRRLHPRAAARA